MHRRTVIFLSLLSLLSSGSLVAEERGVEFFEKKIRPVLVKHCYACHSERAKKLQGGLRLDLKAGWQRGGDSGEAAIVPGKPDKSPLLLAIQHHGDVTAMPPNKPKLSPQILQDVARWIAIGAPDPRVGRLQSGNHTAWETQFQQRLNWWSLKPVARVSPPQLARNGWSNRPIDRFILKRLQQHQLQPAAAADAHTLLRRLSFVLTGLPPAVAEVNSFPQQYAAAPQAAFAALVDRLLASPHYGERMARHWMDVVRYTDTYGYEWDNPAKGSWQYRDYLIRAFNGDVGFDQLVREQIAGDLLSPPRIHATGGFNESLIGPMFYHMGEHRHGDNTRINGVREETIDNKIDAFSKAFLAMTVACARCHDHKLDAISQRDYYALASVFMTPRWTARSIESPDHNADAITRLKGLREAIERRTKQLWKRHAPQLDTGKSLKAWAIANRTTAAKVGDIEWLLNGLLSKPSWGRQKNLAATAAQPATKLTKLADGSFLAAGQLPTSDVYTVTFETPPGPADVVRLAALTHDQLGRRGPGRTPHGNFVLSHITVSVQPFAAATATSPPQQVPLKSARADYSQPHYPVAHALDPSSNRGWGVGLGGNVDRTAWFTFARPVNLPHGGKWTVTLKCEFGSNHILGRFRVAVGSEKTLSKDGTALPTTGQWKQLVASWRKTRAARRQANARFTVLADFSASPRLPAGWFADGQGMKHGHVATAKPLIALTGETAVEQLLPPGYHTHALSSKLAGAIRLPDHRSIPGKHVSFALAGEQWSGFSKVADNGFQGESTVYLDQRQPTWRTFSDGRRANGIQRVDGEIATCDLNPGFLPRTGVAQVNGKRLPDKDEGIGKRSWFSITGIVRHDQPGTPADELGEYASLFDSAPPPDVNDIWPRVGRWLSSSVRRYAAGKPTVTDVKLINWLLTRNLLPRSTRYDTELAALVREYRQVESTVSFPRTANSMDERGVRPATYALNIRGDINVRGPKIPHNFLKAFGAWHSVGKSGGSGRLELARFLTDERHALIARVYVNRVWQWVFGAGLVRTPNDFGHLGERPSHPELLDYLARAFVQDGWSTKRLIRRLVLTRTFRQSGAAVAAARATDPSNRWLHHYPTRRLEAESIRDALLAASGRLDARLFGRPINPRRRVEDTKKRLFSGPLDGHGRRSIYLEVSIMDRSKFLQTFNAPDPKIPTGVRDITNGPAQALAMLNDPFVQAMADHWAQRLAKSVDNDDARLRTVFLQALGRTPRAGEVQRFSQLIKALAAQKYAAADVWRHVTHTVFNMQEFIHFR